MSSCNALFFISYLFTRLVAYLVGLLKVFLGLLDIGLDGSATLLPASRANFTVFVSELESFDQTQDLIDAAANGEIVDGDLSNGTLGRDDEQTWSRGNQS